MNTVLFDLDGTLLSMDLDEFIQRYFGLIIARFKDSEYDEQLIIKAILGGTEAMQKNDGSKRNDEVFWETFEMITKIPVAKIIDDFESFYESDFQKIETAVKVNQAMVAAVDMLKAKGYRLICATNPLFPHIASTSRLRWSGVDTTAFEYVTTFEDFHFCKPNPKYFEEVLEKYQIKKEDCVMIGNDMVEDGAVQALGIPLYLIEDHLIKAEGVNITPAWQGDSKAFLEVVKSFPDLNK